MKMEIYLIHLKLLKFVFFLKGLHPQSAREHACTCSSGPRLAVTSPIGIGDIRRRDRPEMNVFGSAQVTDIVIHCGRGSSRSSLSLTLPFHIRP